RLMRDPRIIRNHLKIEAAISNARTLLDIRVSHGSFMGWLDQHHRLDIADWTRLFKKTFRYTGGEITASFLMSTGYLPGAHHPTCPVHETIRTLHPKWMQ
ncbi:MAG TPA: DNA-3-methyladenine glycosylase, partial [Gemmatimonadetes bacterium]|nr:DNA-3-methyladenine glycosylase [Gemmatimonadota bacterium]